MIEADAPGKLVVAGEYAVLYGAAALAVTVDARARVRLARLGNGPSELLTGAATGAGFRWSGDGTLRWTGAAPGPNGRPLESVLAALSAAGCLSAADELPACRIEISSDEFQTTLADGTRSKLGLGSSAAVTVALTAGLLRLLGRDVPQGRLLELCLDAHRRLQGGLGSGLDVAASLLGGVVAREPAGTMVPLAWPHPLRMLAIWTGAGASTTDLLRRYEAWQQQDPQAFAAQLESMTAVAGRAQRAWCAADLDRLLPALAAYDEALLELDRMAGIGIYTPAHHRLRELAHAHGLVYKPSGAGGGDFGVALGTDEAAVELLSGACEAEGLVPLDAKLCASGLQVGGTVAGI